MTTHPVDITPPTPAASRAPLALVTGTVLPPPPDISTDDWTEDPETRRTMPPLSTALDLGGPAYPDFTGNTLRLDTALTMQPHWLSDAKGEPFTFRLNANLSRMVAMIVEHAGTPYRTKSDFFRDAAYYLAVAVRDLVNIKDERMLNLMREADARANADYESTLQEEVTTFEHLVTDALLGTLERGALGESCRQLTARWGDIQAMPVRHRREAHERAMKNSILVTVVAEIGHQRGFDVPAALLPTAVNPI